MVTTKEILSDSIPIVSGDSHTQVNPAVTLSAVSGPPKTIVTIKGTGFTPLTAIAFTFDGISFTPNEGAQTSDGSGNFICSYTIPVATVGAKTFSITDRISTDQHPTFTINGTIYALPYTDADAFTKDMLKSYKAGEVDGIVIDTSSLATAIALDMRGCQEILIQIINTHATQTLGYSIFGTCIESATPPAFSAANYSALPSGANAALAAGTNDIKIEPDNYSWLVIQFNTTTPGSNSQATVIGRQKQ